MSGVSDLCLGRDRGQNIDVQVSGTAGMTLTQRVLERLIVGGREPAEAGIIPAACDPIRALPAICGLQLRDKARPLPLRLYDGLGGASHRRVCDPDVEAGALRFGGVVYRCLLPVGIVPVPKEDIMQGYVARKGDRFYAVIYEGIDPITGRERRRWHPAGTNRSVAGQLASELARRRCRDGDHERAQPHARRLPHPTVAAFQATIPACRARGTPIDANINLHVIPRIGRVPLRHLRPDHLERLYADLLDDGRASGVGGLHNKTVVEIHMIVRPRSTTPSAGAG